MNVTRTTFQISELISTFIAIHQKQSNRGQYLKFAMNIELSNLLLITLNVYNGRRLNQINYPFFQCFYFFLKRKNEIYHSEINHN